MQTSLFSELEDTPQIDGLVVVDHYISGSLAGELITQIDAQPWGTALVRRVQQYGWRYDYRASDVAASDRLGDLPGWAESLATRLVADGHFTQTPDQVIVNDYQPGQGIALHTDQPDAFGPVVATLSLISPVQFDMEGPDGAKQALLLEPGSLCVMSGPARYQWRHGIAGRMSDKRWGIQRARRISVTFRNVAQRAR